MERSGIRIEFKETLLMAGEIRQSNQILFNGKLLEDLIPERRQGEFLRFLLRHVGKDVVCRTVEHEGAAYESIRNG